MEVVQEAPQQQSVETSYADPFKAPWTHKDTLPSQFRVSTFINEEHYVYQQPVFNPENILLSTQTRTTTDALIKAVYQFMNTRRYDVTFNSPPSTLMLLQYNNEQNKENNNTFVHKAVMMVNHFTMLPPDTFNTFLGKIDELSEILKQKCAEQNWDVSHWSPPFRMNNGVISGVYVKIKNPTIVTLLQNRKWMEMTMLKVTCVYSAPKRSGFCLEMVDTLPM